MTIHIGIDGCTSGIIAEIAVLIMGQYFETIKVITSSKYKQEDNLAAIEKIKTMTDRMNKMIRKTSNKQNGICSNQKNKQIFIEYYHHYSNPKNVPNGYNFSRTECYY